MKQKDIFEGYFNNELSRTDYTNTVKMINSKKNPLLKSIRRLKKLQEKELLSNFTGNNITNRFLFIQKSIERIEWDFEKKKITKIKFISKSA